MKKIVSIKKFLVVSILISYSFFTLFTLVSFGHSHNHMDNMNENCPYMAGGYELCVNIFNHIEGWYSFFNVVISKILILLAVVIFYYYLYLNFFPKLVFFSRYRSTKLPDEYYQSLFSKGILNPKAP